jgi:hypothetical protein
MCAAMGSTPNGQKLKPQKGIVKLFGLSAGICGRIAMNADDGATTDRRTRINPTKGAQDARTQECGIRFLYVRAATYDTFNVQRHLTSAKTHRASRASAMQTWREVAAAA